MAVCRDRGRPVLIHTNERSARLPGKPPTRLPRSTGWSNVSGETPSFSPTGRGLFFYSLLKKEVKDRSRTSISTRPPLHSFMIRPSTMAVELVGVEKILFGSDYPLIEPQRYFKELDSLQLPIEQRAQICGLNARTVVEDLAWIQPDKNTAPFSREKGPPMSAFTVAVVRYEEPERSSAGSGDVPRLDHLPPRAKVFIKPTSSSGPGPCLSQVGGRHHHARRRGCGPAAEGARHRRRHHREAPSP